MGYGDGIIGGFNYVPSPGDFLNSHSLLNAGRAGAPVSNNVYANNPNAYIHRIRDDGFVPHAGIVDRRSPGYQASRLRPQESGSGEQQPPQPAASHGTLQHRARAGRRDRQLFRRVADPGLAERFTRRRRPDHEARYLGSGVPGCRRIWSRSSGQPPITTVTPARNQAARVWSTRLAVHSQPYDAADRGELPPVPAVALRLACGRGQSHRACLEPANPTP